MADEPENQGPPPARRDGRRNDGRFGAGNSFGRGSPHARYQAELRAAMLQATTKEDVVSVLGVMKSLALVGDKDAARLYLEHTVGKARETALDWVDIELPKLDGPAAFAIWQSRVIESATEGLIPISIAEKLSEMAEKARRAYETEKLADQIAAMADDQRDLEDDE